MSVQYPETHATIINSKTVRTKKRGMMCFSPGQSDSGYGAKIATDTMVQVVQIPRNNRWYRVYCTCFSNVASHWIMVKGKRMYT